MRRSGPWSTATPYPTSLEPLRREMEAARRVCDTAERLGRPNRDMEAIAQADWEMEKRLAYFPSGTTGLAEHYEGGSPFGEADLEAMGQAFFKIWGTPMPVSTRGESAVHRSMGFDHTGRFDVALSPSAAAGRLGAPLPHGKARNLFCIPQRGAGQGHRSTYPYWAGQHAPGAEELIREWRI